jgi:YD repeat-containing protein
MGTDLFLVSSFVLSPAPRAAPPRERRLNRSVPNSENLYDALNRVRQTRDAAGNNTTTTWDVFDNPKTVTDPRGLTTTYTYNGFGEVTTLDSPDTGTTTYVYDKAGNRTQQVDARPVTVNYTYDALNRLTKVDYPSDTDTTLTYDQTATGGPGAKGRLTTMVDAAGTTKYQYDKRGNVIRKDVTLGGVTYVTQYAYNGADQLTQVTYPSGMVVNYTRNTAGQVSIVQSVTNVTTTLASSLQYEPFGPLKGLTYGNGIVEARSFDLAGRLSGITAPGKQSQTFGYDPADNLTSITDTLRAVQGGTFGYDALSRLTTQTSAASNRIFSYDPTGNRTQTQQTSAPTSTVPFTINPTSNRVGQRAGVAVPYDAAGNQTGDPETNATYTYDQGGRLRTASIGGVLRSTRTYNGLGQRALKDSTPHDNRVIRAVYDEAGHVLSEAVLQGGTLLHYREYVWLEDRPLAQMTNVKAGSTWTSSVIDREKKGTDLFLASSFVLSPATRPAPLRPAKGG